MIRNNISIVFYLYYKFLKSCYFRSTAINSIIIAEDNGSINVHIQTLIIP
jgi:hypothetical protein